MDRSRNDPLFEVDTSVRKSPYSFILDLDQIHRISKIFCRAIEEKLILKDYRQESFTQSLKENYNFRIFSEKIAKNCSSAHVDFRFGNTSRKKLRKIWNKVLGCIFFENEVFAQKWKSDLRRAAKNLALEVWKKIGIIQLFCRKKFFCTYRIQIGE